MYSLYPDALDVSFAVEVLVDERHALHPVLTFPSRLRWPV